MTTPQLVTIQLDRRLLEHPQAIHVHRMRTAVWLYLVLLSRLTKGQDTIDIGPAEVAHAMGLPEGTIRSWLGHLRHSGYIRTEGRNGAVQVIFRRREATPPKDDASRRQRTFTVDGLARALGDGADRTALAETLANHSDIEIRRGLARALAVPTERIRKSRMALFLYFLKHS